MKFIEGVKFETDDIVYDLVYGSVRIKPNELLVDLKDIMKVNSAIATLKLFITEAEKQEVVEYY